LYFPEENPKQLVQDEIIEILHQAKTLDPEWHEGMKQWLMKTFTFLKCSMKNQFLISSIWRTWRRSDAPTAPILLHYQ
jgi:hypothetical protein